MGGRIAAFDGKIDGEVLVVQRIERLPPKRQIRVRFPAGTQGFSDDEEVWEERKGVFRWKASKRSLFKGFLGNLD